MKTKRHIRKLLLLFMVALALSGITAFPLHAEADFMLRHISHFPYFFHAWIHRIHHAVYNASLLMHYGTDWLAFAHLIIALFFIPVYMNPVKYCINLRIAQVACILVFPLAFICGPIRGIPFFHQVIDCSFGIIGFLLLNFTYKRIQHLELHENNRL